MTAPAAPYAARIAPALPNAPTPPARMAESALVALWDALEAMTPDEAWRFLHSTPTAFLLGLDVEAVLDALSRDRARARARARTLFGAGGRP
jgi:hypothetical protein